MVCITATITVSITVLILNLQDGQKKQYNLKFIIKDTNCSKSDHAILGDECAIEQDSVSVTCTF